MDEAELSALVAEIKDHLLFNMRRVRKARLVTALNHVLSECQDAARYGRELETGRVVQRVAEVLRPQEQPAPSTRRR